MSDIALLLGAVLEEAVHQLGIDQISRLQVVEHPVATMVGHPAQDSEARDENCVVVVPTRGLLAQPDKRGEASHRDQLLAHGVHAAQPEEGELVRSAASRCLNLIIRGRQILLQRAHQLVFGEYIKSWAALAGVRVCSGNYLDRAIAAFFKTRSAAAASAWVGEEPGDVASRESRKPSPSCWRIEALHSSLAARLASTVAT